MLATRSAAQDNWPELQRSMTRWSAAVVALAAWFGWYGVLQNRPTDFRLMVLAVGVAAGCVGLAFLPAVPSSVAAASQIGLLALALYVTYADAGLSPAAPFLTVPIALAAFLLSPWLALPLALAAALLVALLPGLPGEQVWIFHMLYFLVALLSLVLARDLRRALDVAWMHADRVAILLHEVNLRREEVSGLNRALSLSNALLKRSLAELAVAQGDAEEAREVKARFAANISHELRTPLNLIMGFSRMMHRSPEVYGDVRWTPELRVDVHEIYRASMHLLGMIDDILDLSRVDAQRLPLKLEPADIAQLIEEAASTARGLLRGKPVTLSLAVPEGLPSLVADRTRVRQVLLNLLNNAIRFTDEGEIRVSASQVGAEIEVTIADTGVGIAPGDLSSIFDEFSQGSGPITSGRGGAGLGLAVCKQFVQLHGGRIWVESAVGMGSSFHFRLPLPEGGRARSRLAYYAPEGWSQPLPSGAPGKSVVVLAPDEASALSVSRGIDGYRSIPLTDIRQLADVVEAEHPAGIVLVRDLLLGGGPRPEDIWEASGRPDLGVIECEVPLEEVAKRYLQVAAYLTKPVQIEQIVAAIENSGPAPERILVVDDDPGFRALMQRALVAAYPRALFELCPGGEQALHMLRQDHFDLVLLDLVMPGKTGIELLLSAREAGLLSGSRVIITTGAPYVEELAARFPARLCFSKQTPPRSGEVLRCVRSLLDCAPADYTRREAAARSPAARLEQPAS